MSANGSRLPTLLEYTRSSPNLTQVQDSRHKWPGTVLHQLSLLYPQRKLELQDCTGS